MTDVLRIASRFNGPPGSGNGGYVCGRLAAFVTAADAVEVTLRRPPPLERDLTVEHQADGVTVLKDGDALVAEAAAALLELELREPPDADEAEQAAQRYTGFVEHAFPTCFVCGPDRAHGDGLRIFAGPTSTRSLVAAPWTPHPSVCDRERRVPAEALWSALDCPGYFAVRRDVGVGVLGRMTARIFGDVRAGEPCRVVAWPLGGQGRRFDAGSAVFDASGNALAAARTTWVTVA